MSGAIIGSMFVRHNALVAGRYPYTTSGWIQFPSGGADGFTQFLPTGLDAVAAVRLLDRLQMVREFGYDDTGADLFTDVWYYIALVIEETSQKLYLGADGDTELTLVATFTNTLTGYANAGNHQLHYRDESTDHNVMLQWRAWDAALTKAELEAEAASATPVITSDLVTDYRFEEGALDQDSSGNDYDINVGAGSLTHWTGALPSFGGGGSTADLAGTIDGAATVTGNLTGRAALVGTSAGAATATASLRGRAAASGTAAGAATASGALRALARITAAVAGAATAVGALIGRARLSGTSAGAATASGDLTATDNAVQLSGVVAGSSTATATLSGRASLSGASAGAANASARLTGSEYVFPTRFRLIAETVDTAPQAETINTSPASEAA